MARRRIVGWISVVLLAVACTESDAPRAPVDASPSRTVDASGEEPETGGSLTFGVIGEPATLDPYSPLASDLTYALVRPLYPSLVRTLPDGSVEPFLAESLAQTNDGGVIVSLKKARWSNGRRISARDVIASIRRARPPSGFAHVRSAHPQRNGRAVLLTGPARLDWWKTLARASFVLPRGRPSHTVFGGPFVLRDRTPGLGLSYERNEDFFGPAPLLDRIELRYVERMEIMLLLLERGRLDAAEPLSTVNLDDRLGALDLFRAEARGPETIDLLFEPSLTSAERAAIARRIDLSVIQEGLIKEDGRLVRGPRPRGLGTRLSGVLMIATPLGDELLELIQRIVQRQLQGPDLEVQLVPVDHRTFYGEWQRANPVDMLLARSTGTPTEDLWRLFEVESVLAWQPSVHGLEPNPTLEGPLWNAEQWWVE